MFGPTIDFCIIFYLGGLVSLIPLGIITYVSDAEVLDQRGDFDTIMGSFIFWPFLLLFFFLFFFPHPTERDSIPYNVTSTLIVILLGVLGGGMSCGYIFPDISHTLPVESSSVIFGAVYVFGVAFFISESFKTSFTIMTVIMMLVAGLYTYHILNLSPEEQLARERAQLAEEKREIEKNHKQLLEEAERRVMQETERRYAEARAQKAQMAQDIKDAHARIEIAKVQAERAKLRKQPIPKEVAEQIAQANKQLEQLQSVSSAKASGSDELAKAREELARLKREGVDYSQLSEPQVTSALPVKTQGPNSPNPPMDKQTELILSGLWLGVCFFLQQVFEKTFKDKRLALLTVCALGFLIAFFTANYFLVGGSITGGLIGSVGDRG